MVLDQVAFLLAGASLALGSHLLFLLSKHRPLDAPTRFLGLLILACVANAAHPALIRWTGLAPQDSVTFLEPLQFLLPPLLAAYAWTAMRGEHRWSWLRLFHLAPFGVAVAVAAWFASHPPTPLVSVVYWTLLSVQMVAYLVPALALFHRHEASLAQRLSNLGPVDLSWLRRFFWVAAGLCVSALVVVVLLLHDLGPAWLAPGVSASLLGALWVLGTKGLEQRFAVVEAEEDTPDEPKERSAATVAEVARVRDGLRTLFETEKLHLDPDLELATLVARLGAPRNLVSQVLNQELGVSFHDWVNGWRLQEFRSLARDPRNDDEKLLTLAFASGFNAKPTFNKVVLKLSGVTPSTLRQREIASRKIPGDDSGDSSS